MRSAYDLDRRRVNDNIVNGQPALTYDAAWIEPPDLQLSHADIIQVIRSPLLSDTPGINIRIRNQPEVFDRCISRHQIEIQPVIGHAVKAVGRPDHRLLEPGIQDRLPMPAKIPSNTRYADQQQDDDADYPFPDCLHPG